MDLSLHKAGGGPRMFAFAPFEPGLAGAGVLMSTWWWDSSSKKTVGILVSHRSQGQSWDRRLCAPDPESKRSAALRWWLDGMSSGSEFFPCTLPLLGLRPRYLIYLTSVSYPWSGDGSTVKEGLSWGFSENFCKDLGPRRCPLKLPPFWGVGGQGTLPYSKALLHSSKKVTKDLLPSHA